MLIKIEQIFFSFKVRTAFANNDNYYSNAALYLLITPALLLYTAKETVETFITPNIAKRYQFLRYIYINFIFFITKIFCRE
jgi:hypothetical protein